MKANPPRGRLRSCGTPAALRWLLARGWTQAELARRYGVTRQAINSFRHAPEHPRSGVRPLKLEPYVDQIRELCADGYWLAKLARHFGVATATVKSFLAREGIVAQKGRSSGRPRKEAKDG